VWHTPCQHRSVDPNPRQSQQGATLHHPSLSTSTRRHRVRLSRPQLPRCSPVLYMGIDYVPYQRCERNDLRREGQRPTVNWRRRLRMAVTPPMRRNDRFKPRRDHPESPVPREQHIEGYLPTRHEWLCDKRKAQPSRLLWARYSCGRLPSWSMGRAESRPRSNFWQSALPTRT
jgi:hypothetical protein